jgi:tetratricopeptide (TPR) repeat protein
MMRPQFAALPLAAALLFGAAPCPPALAQGSAPTAPAASPAETQEREFDRLRVSGFQYLYNLDYASARKDFERMTTLAPTRASGYLYVANCMWLEQLNKSRRLQTNLYGGNSFFSDTKESVDPAFDKEYRDAIARAIAVADMRLKESPKDVESLYYKGAAHGALAAYEATVTRAFISALKNSNKSVDLHKEVLKLEPSFADANLTVGLYNYVVGSLPLPVKLVVALGGVRGSRKRGLELLRTVTTDGRYAQEDARVVLIALYKREKKYAEALTELEYFVKRFPDNYVVKMEYADTLVRLGKTDVGLKIFDDLTKDEKAASYRDLIEYQFAEALFSQGRPEDALAHFRAAIAAPNANQGLVSLSHLRVGAIHDLAGRRQEALEEYGVVLKRQNVYDSHEQAKNYSKKPYDRSAEKSEETGAEKES